MIRFYFFPALLWVAVAIPGEALAQGCGQSNPNCIVPTAPPGTSNNQAASTAFVNNSVSGIYSQPHTWTAAQTLSAFVTFATPAAFIYAGNSLSLNTLFSVTNFTVPANSTYTDIRISQLNGSDNGATVGANGVYVPIYSTPRCLVGSSASSNCYGAVLHATNAGPGIVRGAHLGGFAAAGSTGVISAAALQIQPVGTTVGAYGTYASLTSSGANGIATAHAIETDGDTYAFGMIGGSVSPLPVTQSFIQWNVASGSAAGAAFLKLISPSSTISFQVDRDGATTAASLVSASLVGGTTAGQNLVIGSTSSGSPSGDNLAFRGSTMFFQTATGATTYAVLYPSGGLYLGSGPSDPGGANLRVQGTTTAASLVSPSLVGGAVAAQNLVIRTTSSGSPSGDNLIFRGSTMFFQNAGGATTYAQWYPSGGLYIGSTPSDPGSAGLRVQGTAFVLGLPGSAGGGGLFVCVDTSGAFYKKSTCP